jgi:intein/homing endonuclease
LRSIRDIRLIRWNPEYITVQHNDATAEERFYYSIPPQMANDIRMAKRHIVERVPQVFIEALRQNKALLFSRDNIYHMKRPTIAQKDKGWGMPMILPVLKDVFYLQVLRKAQEAIAVEHIVPLRLLFPQTSSSSADVYCVSLNTLIETREGPRPAQDVRVGDYLKSHMGAWDRVEAIKDRSVPKSEKVYRFKVASLPAFPFELSEEHPIWAARKWSKEKGYDGLSEPDWVNSKDLKKGDFVLYPTIRKTWTSLTLDLAEYIPERAATEHYIYRRLNQASAEIYEYLEERGAVQHQRGEREQLLQERGWLLDDYHNAYSAFSLQEKIDRISRYLPVTEDLAYLVGLYAAEGYLNGGSPCFALHSREVDIRQDIDRIVETLGFRAGCAGTYDVTEEGVTHNVHDVLLGAFLRTACGDKSERKRLPRFVLEAPKNIAMAAARGLLAGDGCNFKTETRRIGLMSVSKDLVVGLRSILLSEGFIPTAQVRIPNEGEIAKLPVYQLNLNGSQADELARRFGWDRLGWVPGKQEHWSQCGFIRDGYVYLRINEIEEAPEVETVRGFQMEGDRSFCVVGVATHNSTINLTQWRDKIEQELIRWRLDNNYIPLLPIPVGQQTLGGEGKALMLAQEYRVWSEQVIAGLGVPIEFVYGGMQFCQKIDSYVFTSKGLLQLKDLIPAGEGQTETGAGVLVATKSGTQPTTACHNTGMKKAARVQTKLGLDSEPSYDHQFLTLGSDLSLEWKKTSDLTPGDHIAVRAGMNLWPTEIPLIQEEVFDQISVWRKSAGGSSAATQYPVPMLPTAVTPGIAKLLGYLISEGTCGETGLVFAQKCQEVMDDFLNTVESTFGYRPSKWKGTEGCTAAEIGRRPAVLLLRGLGAVGVSETKVVPDCIKRAPKHLVVEFLKAYFEGDGSVSTSNTGKQMVSCGSKSEELLKQIQLLLLNIGIVSSRYFYAKTDMWQLQIRSSYIDVFAEEIGFVSSIKQNQLTLRSAVGKTHVGERIPHLKETLDQVRQKYFCGKQSWSFEPVNCQLDKEEYTTHEVADILERDFTTVHYHIKKERLKVSRTLPGVGGRFGTALISRRDLQDFLSKYGRGVHKVIPGRSGDGMTYSRLSSADLTFLREKEPELAKRIEVLAESHYVWDEVQEVELFDFEVPMGDLTVDIDHSYVADGLVTHNSGSNVSMRILENHFLDQKAQRKQLVTDFLMPNIGAFMGWEVIPCHYKKFKMADDLQRSAFNLQLNQAGKLSDRTLLEDVDRDHRAEMNQIKEEQKMILENQRSQALAQASIQGEAQLVGIKYQGRAQKIMMEQQGPMPSPQDQKALSEAGMQASGQPGMASPEATGQAMNTQVGMMNQTGQIPPMQLPQQGDQGQGQQQQDPMAGIQSPLNAGQNGAQPDLVAVAQQVASHLNQLPDHEKQMEMGNMQKTNPQLYSLVLSMVLTTAGADKPSNAAPLPEQRPPQRGPEAAMV